jgi:thioredoxin 1
MESGKVLEVGDLENLKDAIFESKKPIFVDFYTEWCGPCKRISPEINKMAAENKHIQFIKIDIDKDHEVAEEFGIRSVPTFYAIVDKKIIGSAKGADLKSIQELIRKISMV